MPTYTVHVTTTETESYTIEASSEDAAKTIALGQAVDGEQGEWVGVRERSAEVISESR